MEDADYRHVRLQFPVNFTELKRWHGADSYLQYAGAVASRVHRSILKTYRERGNRGGLDADASEIVLAFGEGDRGGVRLPALLALHLEWWLVINGEHTPSHGDVSGSW